MKNSNILIKSLKKNLSEMKKILVNYHDFDLIIYWVKTHVFVTKKMRFYMKNQDLI